MSIIDDFADINRRMNRKPKGLPVCYSDELSAAQVVKIDAMLAKEFARSEFVAVESETDALMAVLRAEVEQMEKHPIEDDGWITLWAY